MGILRDYGLEDVEEPRVFLEGVGGWGELCGCSDCDFWGRGIGGEEREDVSVWRRLAREYVLEEQS